MPLMMEKTARLNLEEALSFRVARPVTQIRLLLNGEGYPICPRCGCSLEREYMNFCNCCGQHLSWKGLAAAKILRWRKPDE